MRLSLVCLCCATLLSACGRGEPDLITFRTDTPDEFAILPTKPLQAPQDYASLPPPTPGAANLVDPTPEADAYAALGGSAAALARPSGDGALVSYAGRNGVAPGIRTELASNDAGYRDRNRGRLLERLFGTTVYFDAYDRQSLDQTSELERFRRAGVRTPSAPPVAIE